MSLNFAKAEFVCSAANRSGFLRDGLPQFAFAGRSNVGKSSVINRLVNRKNLAYVGKTIEGKPIIIVFDNALCTSGLELEGKNKEAAVPKFTFECYADLSPEADTLPWHIYYPTEV